MVCVWGGNSCLVHCLDEHPFFFLSANVWKLVIVRINVNISPESDCQCIINSFFCVPLSLISLTCFLSPYIGSFFFLAVPCFVFFVFSLFSFSFHSFTYFLSLFFVNVYFFYPFLLFFLYSFFSFLSEVKKKRRKV